jgi:hypothetical protein
MRRHFFDQQGMASAQSMQSESFDNLKIYISLKQKAIQTYSIRLYFTTSFFSSVHRAIQKG